jgi:hypothetical protein
VGGKGWAIAAAGLIAIALSGCSKNPDASADDAVEPSSKYPPGTAAALSVNSAAGLPNSDPFQTAATCLAALQVTTQFLEGRSAELPAGAMDALRKATTYFRGKALSEARVGEVAGPEAAIEQKVEEAQAQPAPQVRIAMACLQTISSS